MAKHPKILFCWFRDPKVPMAPATLQAHAGSVLKLAVVRSFIWSSGSDGFIREWTLGGSERQCVREVAPVGFDKGAYNIVPLGHDVWTCGHHPKA